MIEKELILTEILKCRRSDLYMYGMMLNSQQKDQYDEIIKRRNAGEPLQYLLGNCEFMGLRFKVDHRALIPRPETEILVEKVLGCIKASLSGNNRALHILDIGTGSGNIPVSLAKHLPESLVVAIDVSKDALALAHENATDHKVSEQIHFFEADIFKWLQRQAKTLPKFDWIISNPPYIPTAQLKFLPKDVLKEPKIAFNGGKDGLKFYRFIIEHSRDVLKDSGCLIFEIGDGQGQGIEKIFEEFPDFSHIQFFKDHAGTDRIVLAKLLHSFDHRKPVNVKTKKIPNQKSSQMTG